MLVCVCACDSFNSTLDRLFFFVLSASSYSLLFPVPFSDMDVFKALRSSCLQIAIQICYYRLVHRLYKSKIIVMVPSMIQSLCNTTAVHASAAAAAAASSPAITMHRRRLRRRYRREMATALVLKTANTINTTTTIPIRIITIADIHIQTFTVRIFITAIIRILAVCARLLHLWTLNQRPRHIRPNINLMIAY